MMNRHVRSNGIAGKSVPMRRSGVTIVEAVASLVIVGTLLVAALSAAGGMAMSQHRNADRALGILLAQDLMSEILQQAYVDPEDAGVKLKGGKLELEVLGGDGGATYGPESGEVTGNRTRFDDVDDYHRWDASPPQARDGAELASLKGWRQTVTVLPQSAAMLDEELTEELDFKKIIVVLSRKDVPIATLVALRTAAYPKEPVSP